MSQRGEGYGGFWTETGWHEVRTSLEGERERDNNKIRESERREREGGMEKERENEREMSGTCHDAGEF